MKLNFLHYIYVPSSVLGGSRFGFVYTAPEPVMVVAVFQNGYPASALLPVGRGYHPLYQYASQTDFEPLEPGTYSGPFSFFNLYQPALLAVVSGSSLTPSIVFAPAPALRPLLDSVVVACTISNSIFEPPYANVTFSNDATGKITYLKANALDGLTVNNGDLWADLAAGGYIFTPAV